MKSILKQIRDVDYIFSLAYGANGEEPYDGSCPCAEFTLKDSKGTVRAHSRCWRVSEHGDQDLYVWGNHPDLNKIAYALRKALDDTEWYNPYTLVFEEFR